MVARIGGESGRFERHSAVGEGARTAPDPRRQHSFHNRQDPRRAPRGARVGPSRRKATHVRLTSVSRPVARQGRTGRRSGRRRRWRSRRQAEAFYISLVDRKLSINNERSFRQLRAAACRSASGNPTAYPAHQTAYWRGTAGATERSGYPRRRDSYSAAIKLG